MKRCLLLLTIMLMLFLPGRAETADILYTAHVTKNMTIRQKKSTSAKKLGEVHEGEEVQIITLDGQWCEIVKEGISGFILSKNVTEYTAFGDHDDAAEAQFSGVAVKELAVRWKKDKTSNKLLTIAEGSTVFVSSLEGKWLEVVCRGVHGYVQTDGIRELHALRDDVVLPEEYETAPLFEAKYTAQADLNLYIRKKPDKKTDALGTVNEDERIEVMMIEDGWAYVKKHKAEGYVLAEHLKHYRKVDPFGDLIPGTSVYPCAAQVLRSINLFDAETGEWLFTAPAGSVIAISEPSPDGSALLPYHRIIARTTETMSLKLEEVVLWSEAQSGELLAVYSTFYDATPDSTIQMGRIFNIQEGVRRINNTIIKPDETFSFNAVCAPYTKGNGYELGPIVNYVSSQKTGYSGGICQVSTTLYNAVLQMPFEIVKQQPHSSYGIFYAPLDLDAAVGAGNLDLRLKNVLPFDVRIEAQATEGVLTVRIYRA